MEEDIDCDGCEDGEYEGIVDVEGDLYGDCDGTEVTERDEVVVDDTPGVLVVAHVF